MQNETQKTKSELRRNMRRRFRRLSTAQQQHASASVAKQLVSLPALSAVSHVATYAAFAAEINLAALAEVLLARDITLCYPRFNATQKCYDMVAITCPATDLRAGHHGVFEPLPDLPALAKNIQQTDLLWLVPGLAFDRKGARLGRGAGYYDRLLENSEGLKIGVAYQWQLTQDIPIMPHDVLMDMVVTDQEILMTGIRERKDRLCGIS